MWRSRGYLWHVDDGALTHHIVFSLKDAFTPGAFEGLPANPTEKRAAADKLLDQLSGHRLLDDPRAAEIVETALLHFDSERYRMLAWCVMPNHVHAMVHIPERGALANIVHAWKSFTAHEINRTLGRAGAVWRREYFDRYMRDDAHYFATIKYIERNPVAAGLVDAAEEWRWSSARVR